MSINRKNRKELKEFAQNFPKYPVDYIFLLLEGNDNNKDIVSQILSGSEMEVIKEVRRCAELYTKKRQDRIQHFTQMFDKK